LIKGNDANDTQSDNKLDIFSLVVAGQLQEACLRGLRLKQ
jgi:hypothetical protein